MIRSNFHTHTYRCKHAGGTDEELVDMALRHNLSILGFSDHAPYPDNRFGLRMDYDQLLDYVNSVMQLKHHYKNQLDIRLGLEIEYDPSQLDYYDYLLHTLKLDYLALGQHIYVDPCDPTGFTNIYSIDDTSKYIDYAKTVCEAISTGLFAFVAHPDVIFINNLTWDKNCDEACDLLINCALKHNIIFEFNANGIRRELSTYDDGDRYPYPHKRFWDKVSLAQIPTLINSDCHHPDQLWDDIMEQAHQLAASLNLNIVSDMI